MANTKKGPRSRELPCFEGRGATLEEAVLNATKRFEARRLRQAQIYDLQIKVMVGNPITDYIAKLIPPTG
jgi:hypothetical protein